MGLILSSSAQAEGLNDRIYPIQQTVSSSLITIKTAAGSYVFGASAWHSGPRQVKTNELAPKAKIIDVKAALKKPACTYQNNVCVLRLPTDDSL
ncbi:hypothetical protein BJF95_01300 [Rhizobium oryziradicis]|uniref:Uncharacterized protein n=1 Tax=Rhizobium oryziradicis TaxID=1867956 RepID=A0A1Q8ZM35_9HYPH|nr:hypothetical protein BJF95_01300 [Rhizobium oryziradicis]